MRRSFASAPEDAAEEQSAFPTESAAVLEGRGSNEAVFQTRFEFLLPRGYVDRSGR